MFLPWQGDQCWPRFLRESLGSFLSNLFWRASSASVLLTSTLFTIPAKAATICDELRLRRARVCMSSASKSDFVMVTCGLGENGLLLSPSMVPPLGLKAITGKLTAPTTRIGGDELDCISWERKTAVKATR